VDFVYVCRNGDNEELRYSIRSLIKNTESPNIWVVGGKPKWYIGNHIPVQQSTTKYQNVLNNLKAIANSKEISNEFVLMNDDFYIVKPIDKIETYHGGLFQNKINLFAKNVPSSHYTKMLKNTRDKLFDMGIKSPLDYAIHVPMIFEKDKFSTVIEPNHSFRTLYGNIFNVGGIEIDDVKFHRKATREWAVNPDLENLDLPYLSSSDSAFEELYKYVLRGMFPTKTQHERG